MKILVTGSAGFIGSHLVEQLAKAGHDITGMDIMFPKSVCDSFVDDIRYLEPRGGIALANSSFEACIHAAASPDVRGVNPELTWSTNVDGTRRLLDALPASCTRFVFLSSSCVYGHDDEPLWVGQATERQLWPVSLYGASKLAGEGLVSVWAARDPFRRWSAIRPVTVYGARYARGHIKDFVDQARTSGGAPITALDDGSQQKDGVHVLDLCDAVQYALEQVEAGAIDVAGGSWSWRDTARVMGIHVLPGDAREGFVGDARRVTGFDCRRLRGYGWSPKRSCEGGVRETLDSLGWSKKREGRQ